MATTWDIARLRADTPGAAGVAFFNHAGSSPMSNRTRAAIAGHFEREAQDGAMEAAVIAAPLLDAARASAATLLNAPSANDVAFMPSASAGTGLVFAAMPLLKPGDRILVGRHEWGGNASTYAAAAARAGATLEVIPCSDDGSVDAQALARMLDQRVRLVALTWIPANGGLVNDAQAVGAVTSAANVPFVIDAGQALGHIPVDVQALRCDALMGTARKYLRGPRGTAVLYARPSFVAALTPAFLDVQSGPWTDGGPVPREDARVFETIEAPFALLMGLGAALQQANELGVARIDARVQALAGTLRDGLRRIPGVSVQDLGTRQCGLVSFTVAGMGLAEVRQRLAAERLVVGGNGVAYTPFDMTARGLREIVRASISYFNTEEEIQRLVATIERLAA